jgi:hypothetical protein
MSDDNTPAVVPPIKSPFEHQLWYPSEHEVLRPSGSNIPSDHRALHALAYSRSGSVAFVSDVRRTALIHNQTMRSNGTRPENISSHSESHTFTLNAMPYLCHTYFRLPSFLWPTTPSQRSIFALPKVARITIKRSAPFHVL